MSTHAFLPPLVLEPEQWDILAVSYRESVGDLHAEQRVVFDGPVTLDRALEVLDAMATPDA